jgi:hypothetical protein
MRPMPAPQGRNLLPAKRVHRIEHDATVDALLTRYKLDVIPKKAAATRRGDIRALINLRKVFGAMRPRDVLPRHIYTSTNNLWADVTLIGEEASDEASALAAAHGTQDLRFLSFAEKPAALVRP